MIALSEKLLKQNHDKLIPLMEEYLKKVSGKEVMIAISEVAVSGPDAMVILDGFSKLNPVQANNLMHEVTAVMNRVFSGPLTLEVTLHCTLHLTTNSRPSL